MRLSAFGCVALVFLACGCGDTTVGSDGGADGALPLEDAGGAGCDADIECTDELFCNGIERCTATGCEPAEDTTPCDEGTQECVEDDDRCASTDCTNPDADGDSVNAIDCGGLDCDDTDAARYPGATELCDANDHDEDCDDTTYGFRDLDGDGDPDAACCNADPLGALRCGNDCNDTNPTVNTTAPEVCNGRDDDCNGIVDDGMTSLPCFDDGDRDGWAADGATSMINCGGCPVGTTDRDPSTAGADCDDTDMATHPEADELCDMVDQDCDGDTTDITRIPCWADMDNDYWARTGAAMSMECGDPMRMGALYCPAGTTGRNPTIGADCNDANNAIYPMAPEFCDTTDQDCDGSTDEGWCFRDADGDGYAPTGAMRACETGPGSCPSGYTIRNPSTSGNRDCNDVSGDGADEHPGGTETCDGEDDNCDGNLDEGVEQDQPFYVDNDDDGYGTGTTTTTMPWACGGPGPPGYSSNNRDCCDTNASAHPGQTQTQNSSACGGDFNCDGVVTYSYTALTNCPSACPSGGNCTDVGNGNGLCAAPTPSQCGTYPPLCGCSGTCGSCNEADSLRVDNRQLTCL